VSLHRLLPTQPYRYEMSLTRYPCLTIS
jgi:hypothetical protein